MTLLTPEMRRTLPSAEQKRIKRENERQFFLRNPRQEKPATAWRRMQHAMRNGLAYECRAMDVGAGARLWMEKRARKRVSRYLRKGGVRR
jgi:hypothetical protein